MAIEVTTVADDEVVLHDGAAVFVHRDLAPDTTYEFEGVEVRTLARPPGERLATVATVNDVHFGEVEAGIIEGSDVGPTFRALPGEAPYPETMNRAAVREILELDPDAVVAKGDLTAGGDDPELQAFLDCYAAPFGERLHWVRGNHDAYHGATFGDVPCQEVAVPGAILAILDTTIPRAATGRVTADQAEWLDELASRADLPVVVFGHHHIWSPESRNRHAGYYGINPDDSERLIEVFERRPRLTGYFAGHTHRNRVRRFVRTGDIPWAEVASVKEFPGTWAEYRIFEGGILQVHRRINAPEALEWSERTRGMYGGLYTEYAFGTLDDRCFEFGERGCV